MSGRWFRFYAAAIRNPKVARLSDGDYRLWTELLSVASENDGRIPPAEDLKHVLNRRLDHLLSALNRLISGGLIDPLTSGYEPHDWGELQYKSDTSTERVRKYRRSGNVSETPPDTETEAETENNPPNPPEGGKADYAFFGKVIRLIPRDLETWRRVYHGIADIEAELFSLDAWFVANPGKQDDWFHRASSSLNRKHQEALREQAANENGGLRKGGIGI